MGTTILGIGSYHPQTKTEFDSGIRYRALPGAETQLGMGVKAAKRALQNACITVSQIDLVISASAIIIQPIPCNAALYHEALGIPQGVAAMDVCTTCTSFITALDIADMMIKSGRHNRILIISSDIASIALNPDETESYSLFSDGAAAAVVGQGDGRIIASRQYTYSDGAHHTEIRCGGSAHPAFEYDPENINDYRFTMDGLSTVRGVMKVLPKHFNDFLAETQMSVEDIDLLIPHQASYALDFIMKKMKIPFGKYYNIFPLFGNMVSASVPFALCHALENGKIHRGDKLMLVGTAAGLTVNLMALEF